MRPLFNKQRPGPKGYTLETKGLLPEWLQIGLMGAAMILVLGVFGMVLYRLYQLARLML